MLQRITFLTIGQTPRVDLVPDLVPGVDSHLPAGPESTAHMQRRQGIDVRELGALDGMGDDEIARLRPDATDHALVTRLRSGRQAVIGKRWVTERLNHLLRHERPSPHPDPSTKPDDTSLEATVLLCTGHFEGLEPGGLFLDAQHLVDHGVAGLCRGADSIGLLVPLERRKGEHHYEPLPGQRLRTAHASPYQDDDFEAVGRSLSDCSVIVMHCMGYTEPQRDAVVRGSGRPALLARRLVASALRQLL